MMCKTPIFNVDRKVESLWKCGRMKKERILQKI